jgi:hypothetical protein
MYASNAGFHSFIRMGILRIEQKAQPLSHSNQKLTYNLSSAKPHFPDSKLHPLLQEQQIIQIPLLS